MTNVMRLKGLLTSNNPEVVTHSTGEQVENAVYLSGLQGILTNDKDDSWRWGIFIVDAHVEEKVTLTQLVARLSELIHAEGIKKLGLDGFLEVTLDSEPNRYRIRVWDGSIGYEQIP